MSVNVYFSVYRVEKSKVWMNFCHEQVMVVGISSGFNDVERALNLQANLATW